MAKKTKAGVSNDPVAALYGHVLDESEAKFELDGGDISNQRTPTSILVLDLMLDGGPVAGMYLVAGPSQSGKSTIAWTILYGISKLGVPVKMVRDAEGSAAGDREYMANIMHTTVDKLFGKKVDGKYVIPPSIRYSRNNLLRKMFDDIVYTLNRIPDKVYNAERKQWFLRVNMNNKKVSGWASKLGTPDAKLSSKKYKYFPSNPYPQAIIIPDSYPAFVTEGVDEDEEASDRRGLLAGEYSLNIPRIVAKLTQKYVILWGINQLRQNPGKTMGTPFYEPCGEAIQFNAIARLQSKMEWVPEKWKNKGSKYKETSYTLSYEPSVEGEGEDCYSYKRIQLAKNKLGSDPSKAYLRIWTRDHTGKGRGVDPVYDVLQFMETLKLAKMKNGKSRIVVFAKNIKHPFAGKTLEWLEFKTLILAEDTGKAELKDAAAKIYKRLKIDKPFLIKEWCAALIAAGEASKLKVLVQGDRSDSDEKDLEA